MLSNVTPSPFEAEEQGSSDWDEPKFNLADSVDSPMTGTPANGLMLEASASSKGKATDIIERDASYYMESSFMVFQVQKCLFRVPSYLFSKESQVFGGLFNLPQPNPGETEDIEGSSASNPINLPDQYLKEDFRCLMKALYPLSFTTTLQLSKSEWISVLKLSTKWYFINLRKAAISELERMNELTFVENIVLGRKYRICSWIVTGFAGLVNRDTTINDDEAIDVDSAYVTTAYKLYRLREERLKGSYYSFDAKDRIETVFNAELGVVRADEKGFEFHQEDIAFVSATQGVPYPSDSPSNAKKVVKGERVKRPIRKNVVVNAF